MPSDQDAFKKALVGCEKAFSGKPVRIVMVVLEQCFVDTVKMIQPDHRERVMEHVFDAIRKRVLGTEDPPNGLLT